MKKIFLTMCCGCFFLATSVAQTQKVGIGTTNPEATLHIVKGVNDSTYFRVDDQTGKELIRVDRSGNIGVNTSKPGRGLEVDQLRMEGLVTPVDTTHYRSVLVTDTIGNIENISYDYFVRSAPLPKTLKYTSKSTTLDANTTTNSVTELPDGKLRVRYSLGSTGETSFLQFQVTEGNSYTIYWEKAGDTGTAGGSWVGYRFARGRIDGYASVNHSDSAWETFKYRSGNSASATPPALSAYLPDNFNSSARDIVTAIILLENSQLIYRVTALANPALPANSSIGLHGVSSNITLFLEELNIEE